MGVIGGGLFFILAAALALPWLVIVAAPILLVSGVGFAPFAFAGLRLVSVPRKSYLRSNVKSDLGSVRRKILVCDDDLTSIGPLLAALSSIPSDVALFENGHEVLKALKVNEYDLVIMDMMMPELSGENVLRLCDDNLNSEDHRTPVVFYTSGAQRVRESLKDDFRLFKIDGIWGKDMTFDSLTQNLSRALLPV